MTLIGIVGFNFTFPKAFLPFALHLHKLSTVPNDLENKKL